jgi:hypothetical protein
LDVQRDKLQEYAAEKQLDLIETVEEVSSGGIQNGETFSWYAENESLPGKPFLRSPLVVLHARHERRAVRAAQPSLP